MGAFPGEMPLSDRERTTRQLRGSRRGSARGDLSQARDSSSTAPSQSGGPALGGDEMLMFIAQSIAAGDNVEATIQWIEAFSNFLTQYGDDNRVQKLTRNFIYQIAQYLTDNRDEIAVAYTTAVMQLISDQVRDGKVMAVAYVGPTEPENAPIGALWFQTDS